MRAMPIIKSMRMNATAYLCVFLLSLLFSDKAFGQVGIYNKVAKVTYRASSLNPAQTKNLIVRGNNVAFCMGSPAPVQQLRKANLNVLFNWNADYIQAPLTVNTYTVSFVIKAYSTFTGTTGLVATYTPTLTITVDKPQAYMTIDFTGLYNNINRFEVVPSYTPPGSPSPVDNLIMADIYFTEEFDYSVSSPGFSMVNPQPVTFNDNLATFSWTTNCLPAPNYEVQLLRLYNKDITKIADGRIVTANVDWNKALRVETGNSLNELSLSMAEGIGYYVWRVRPIGNGFEGGIGNDRNWGEWSGTGSFTQGSNMAISDGITPYLFYFSYNQYDPYITANPGVGYNPANDGTRNWIFSRSFVEGDAISNGQTNIGEAIGYANGLQMANQKQVRLITDNKTLVSETIYDYSGRAALNTMSAPVDRKTLGYIPEFIKSSTTGTAYSAYDFDYSFTYGPGTINFNNPGAMDQNPNTITGLNGPANYYSSLNETETNVPTADGFPYTRTLFSKDGKNTAVETGMPGLTHKLTNSTTKHTTRTMESSVADMELIRIFGDEAPDEKSVYKTISIDANNSASVTYISKEGKTIATCLSSPGATNLTPLVSASAPSFSVVTNVNANNSSYGSYGFRSFKSLALTEQTNVTLNYGLNANNFTDSSCINKCTTCDYKISLNIVDNSGEAATQTFTFVVQPPQHITENCVPGSVSTTTVVTLQPGSYTIERIIETNTAPNSTSNTYINSFVSMIQAALLTKLTTGIAAVVDDLGVPVPGKPSVDMAVLFTKLNGTDLDDFYAYVGGFDPGQTHINVRVDDCELIRIPVWTCPSHNCQGDDLDFEKHLYAQYNITDPLLKAAKLLEMFPVQAYAPGEFNVVIENMLTYGGYNCEELWKCWEGTVAMFVAQTNTVIPTSNTYSPPGSGVTITSNPNYLDQFLTCTGYKIEGITTNNWAGVSGTSFGYNSHPYAWFNYPNQCCACELAFTETVSCPPLPAPCPPAPPCSVSSNNPAAFITYFNSCVAENIDPNTHLVTASTTVTETNKNMFFKCYLNNTSASVSGGVNLCDPAQTTFTDNTMQGSVDQLVQACKDHCESQYSAFVTSIKDAYHDNNMQIQGDPYVLVPDVAFGGYTFGNTLYGGDPSDVPLSVIFCEANGMLQGCMSMCSINVELDSAALEAQILNITKIIGGIFQVHVPTLAGCSRGYTPTASTGSVPMVQAIVSALNYELELQRQAAPSVGKWWNGYAFIQTVYPSYAGLFKDFKVFVHPDIPSYFSVSSPEECGEIIYRFNKNEGPDGAIPPKAIFTDKSIVPATSAFVYTSNYTEVLSTLVGASVPSFIFETTFAPALLNSVTPKEFVSVSSALYTPIPAFSIALPDNLDGYANPVGYGYWQFKVTKDEICGFEEECPSICYRIVPIPTVAPEDPVDFSPITCATQTLHDIANSINGQISAIIANRESKIRNTYRQACYENLVDNFTASYSLKYHHYTLYYYDRAGNMVKTVAPAGVDVTSITRMTHPPHAFITEYEYNSLAQLVRQKTPDGGETKFIYDDKGKLRFSQNAQQLITGKYSYTKYDKLSRVVEVGEIASPVLNTTNINDLNYPVSGTGTDITVTVYSDAAAGIYYFGNRRQRYLQNRVSYSFTDVDGNVATKADQVSSYYSYDPHGNVEWVIQDIPELGRNYIAYEYDLISGSVVKVRYNEEFPDRFFHRYAYDVDKRIKSVETSSDGIFWEKDAAYSYYLHGPLKRVQIGHDNIQGEDYVYTVLGWLKAKNGINHVFDPGGDGNFTGAGAYVARDAYSMSLGYFAGDYHSGTSIHNSDGTVIGPGNVPATGLFNGNISSWTQNHDNKAMTPGMVSNFVNNKITTRLFAYDELNRLLTATMKKFNNTTALWDATSDYSEAFSYDANGNIMTLQRNANTVTGLAMDNLTYKYYTIAQAGTYTVNPAAPATTQLASNMLEHVDDGSGANGYSDIEDQAAANYTYDAIGNLKSDAKENISLITWNVYGKIASIKKTNNDLITFLYDASGNRVYKKHTLAAQPVTGDKTTYYVRDAQGNAMSIYQRTNTGTSPNYTATFTLQEQSIFGSERLGTRSVPIARTVPYTTAPAEQINPAAVHTSAYANLLMPLVFNSTLKKVFVKTIDAASTSPSTIPMSGDLHASTMVNSNTFRHGRAQAIVHDLAGNIALTAFVYSTLTGTVTVSNTTKIYAKGYTVTVPADIKNSPDCQAVFVQKPGSADEYYLFTVGTDGKPYYHTIDASIGAIVDYNNLLDNNAGYGQTIAAFDDRVGQGNSTVYYKYYSSGTVYLNMFSVTSSGISQVPSYSVGAASAATDIGDIQISTNGGYLALANNVTISSNNYGEVYLYSLASDHKTLTYVAKRSFGPGNYAKSLEFAASDNYMFMTVHAGTTSDLYRVPITSFASSPSVLMKTQAGTSSVSSIRKGTNNFLYYLTNTTAGTTTDVNMFTAPETSTVTVTSTLTNSVSNGSLAVQPHLLAYKAPSSPVVVYNRELTFRDYELKDHLGNVHVTVADYKVPNNDVSTDKVYDERFNDGTTGGFIVNVGSPGGTVVDNVDNTLRVKGTAMGSAAYKQITLPNTLGGYYSLSFDYLPGTCTFAVWQVTNLALYGGLQVEGRNNFIVNVPPTVGVLDLRFIYNESFNGHSFYIDNILVKKLDPSAPGIATVVSDNFSTTGLTSWAAQNVTLNYSLSTMKITKNGPTGMYAATRNVNLVEGQLYKVSFNIPATNLNPVPQPNSPALNLLQFGYENDENTAWLDYHTDIVISGTGPYVYYIIPKTNAGTVYFTVANAGGGNFEAQIDNFMIEHVSGGFQPMYAAVMTTLTDYYSFGAPMPGRTFNSPDYKYGMNGQEKDLEFFEGAYSAKYWEYDSRSGRRWNTDPVVASWESSYASFANNPVKYSDTKGDSPTEPKGGKTTVVNEPAGTVTVSPPGTCQTCGTATNKTSSDLHAVVAPGGAGSQIPTPPAPTETYPLYVNNVPLIDKTGSNNLYAASKSNTLNYYYQADVSEPDVLDGVDAPGTDITFGVGPVSYNVVTADVSVTGTYNKKYTASVNPYTLGVNNTQVGANGVSYYGNTAGASGSSQTQTYYVMDGKTMALSRVDKTIVTTETNMVVLKANSIKVIKTTTPVGGVSKTETVFNTTYYSAGVSGSSGAFSGGFMTPVSSRSHIKPLPVVNPFIKK